MEYQVIYRTNTTEQEKEEAVASMNQICLDCDQKPTYTLADIPDTMTIALFAANRIDLGYRLKHERKIDPDSIVTVTVLRDDSDELVSDIKLLSLASEEETCCDFDWTTDNVLNFARKVIEAYKVAHNEDAGRED